MSVTYSDGSFQTLVTDVNYVEKRYGTIFALLDENELRLEMRFANGNTDVYETFI